MTTSAIAVEDLVQFEEENPFNKFLAQTSWWIVSLFFHGLIIALAGLLSMSMSFSVADDTVVMLTTLEARPIINPTEVAKKEHAKSALESKFDIPPTDINSDVESNVMVPPELLKLAELGDKWQTYTPDATEDDGARGTLDAHMFFELRGTSPDEKAGGGGLGGVSLDDIIGVGGAASPGKDGGWGGGDGLGKGLDNGDGCGSYGWRCKGSRRAMIKRHKGTPATENAVNIALRWLAYHQEADGHWDTRKYSSQQKTDTACTGLAVLAFLGAGHTEKVGEYKENVRKAVEWLKSKQNNDGLIWDNTDAGAHRGIGYPAAIATMALAEAAGMANVPATKKAAQLAIDYCTEKHQFGDASDKLGFRYAPKSVGDISVTGWFTMALKSAKIAGLHVNPMSFDGVLKFLNTLERKAERADSSYGAAYRYEYQPNTGSNPRRCAIGNLIKQFTGFKKEELQSSVNLFVQEGGVPAYGANGEKVDLYYWYYGTLCVFQQGGDVWKQWNDSMKVILPENQCKQGDDAGSWNPVGEWSSEWGRVGQTALSCLCLEVYYRFLQINN